MARAHRLAVTTAAVIGALIVAGALAAIISSGGSRPRPARHQLVGAPPPPSLSAPPTSSAGGSPVTPETTVPADTPVQQQYDQGFEEGFASPANRAELARLEAVRLPGPGISGWPALTVANTPDGWAREFVTGLLDIDFARQNRNALGPWLVSQEAPDLMPGVPPGGQYAGLYATVLEPGATGQPSPIPSPARWRVDAAAGVRWSVSGLQVQLEPQWQSMIDAGWQPTDLRGTVEDVSGLLTVTRGKTSTVRRFSLGLQLGSARWHDGYGSVLLAGWKES